LFREWGGDDSTTGPGGNRWWWVRWSLCREGPGGQAGRGHAGGSQEPPYLSTSSLPGRHRRALSGGDRVAAAADSAPRPQYRGPPRRGRGLRHGGAAGEAAGWRGASL